MISQHRWPAPLVALALLGVAPGCRQAEEASASRPSAHDDHDHDHDHEHGQDHDHPHAEHVDPPHWPSDFPDAVERLVSGHAATRAALAAGQTGTAWKTLLPIQRDLARWLPDLAADSDMPEPAWDRAHAAAGPLLAGYEAVLAERKLDPASALDRLTALEPALGELRRVRDTAAPDWFPPVPYPKPVFGAAAEGPPAEAPSSNTTH